jgi:hypothetical protein
MLKEGLFLKEYLLKPLLIQEKIFKASFAFDELYFKS